MESAPPLILPDEVWGNVFKHIENADAWKFRLVCSAWRKELDAHYNKWEVILDENCPYFQHYLQLRVKEATVVDLLSPVDMGQRQHEGSPRLFKYPELVEKLYKPAEKDGMCPENLLLLLNSCGRNLKCLDLDCRHLSSEEEQGSEEPITLDSLLTHASYNLHPIGFDFHDLQTLRLDFEYFCSPRPAPLIQEHTLFHMLLARSTMTKIKSLRISISYLNMTDVASTILSFIEKNGMNLEKIHCSICPNFEEGEGAQLPAISINLAVLTQIVRLKKFKIEYDFLYRDEQEIPWDWELVEAWSSLLKVQKNLTALYLKGLPISIRIVQLACNNNQATLTKFKLFLPMGFDLDLTILAGCVNLKALSVSSWGLDFDAVVRNARSLPVGLQKFESSDCLIESEDILDFFIGHQELEEISLKYSGSDGSNGVTPSVFARFLSDRNLSDKLRRMVILGFNHSRADDDLATLNGILRGFQICEKRDDFGKVRISMNRSKDLGGHWSGWKVESD